MPGFGLEREQELDFQGVYRLPADGGALQLLVDDFAQPNGLCFSPDESLLYVNDTVHAHIRVFDVGPEHALSNGRVFAEGIGTGDLTTGELVDGMKLDERGNVYVTGPKGVWVFGPDGEHLGVIEVPENVGNVNWGDDDWRTLYIPASTSVYRIRMKVGGNRSATCAERARRAMDAIDPKAAALVIQDLQNDVIIEGGAFADSGAPAHATSQNVVENVKGLAAACRAAGVPVIHVWYIVEPGAPGLKQNAPLFQGVKGANALVRGTWGAAPADGLEPQEGDHVVEKMRMNGFYNTRLDILLRGLGAETLIISGAWTNMSIEHTARHAADAGYRAVVASDGTSTVNDEWQHAALSYAMQNVAPVGTCAEIAAALGS